VTPFEGAVVVGSVDVVLLEVLVVVVTGPDVPVVVAGIEVKPPPRDRRSSLVVDWCSCPTRRLGSMHRSSLSISH
jgi:hypothetical protein